MSIGDAGRNYTDIRNDALVAADKLGDRSKHLRLKDGGKMLYLHDSKSNSISSLSPHRIPQRLAKRERAANEIREAINAQFSGLKDRRGNDLKVGDLVFRNLRQKSSVWEGSDRFNKKAIRVSDFSKIDAEIAKVLGQARPNSELQGKQVQRVAESMRLAGVGALRKLALPNLTAVQRQAAGFREALRRDALAAGQSPAVAKKISDSIVEAMQKGGTFTATGFNRLDVDMGLNHEQIDTAAALLQQNGVRNPSHLNELRQSLNVNLKARNATPVMGAACDKLEAITESLKHSDDATVRQVARFADANRRLTRSLPQMSRHQATKQLARQVSIGKHLIAKLESHQGGGWVGQKAPEMAAALREHVAAANDLLVACLPRGSRYNIAARPNTTPRSELNKPSALYDQPAPQFGAGHKADGVSRVLYSATSGAVSSPSGQEVKSSILVRQMTLYDRALSRVGAALQNFKADPSDQSLAALMDSLNKASLASDSYQKALQLGGNRTRRQNSGRGSTRLNRARRAVAEQRGKLNELRLQASTINDQRNAMARGTQLPAAHPNDRTQGLKRQLDGEMLAFLQNPFARQAPLSNQPLPGNQPQNQPIGQPIGQPAPPIIDPGQMNLELPDAPPVLDPNQIPNTQGNDSDSEVSVSESVPPLLDQNEGDGLDELSLLGDQITEGHEVELQQLDDSFVVDDDFDAEQALIDLGPQRLPKGVDPNEQSRRASLFGSPDGVVTPAGKEVGPLFDDPNAGDEDDEVLSESEEPTPLGDEPLDDLRRDNDEDDPPIGPLMGNQPRNQVDEELPINPPQRRDSDQSDGANSVASSSVPKEPEPQQGIGQPSEKVGKVDAPEDVVITNPRQVAKLCEQVFGIGPDEILDYIAEEVLDGFEEWEEGDDGLEMSIVNGRLRITVSDFDDFEGEFSVDFGPGQAEPDDLQVLQARKAEIDAEPYVADSFGTDVAGFKASVAEMMGWPADAIPHMSVAFIEVEATDDDPERLGFRFTIEGYKDIEHMSVDFMPADDEDPGLVHLGIARLAKGKQGSGTMVRFMMGMATKMEDGAFSKAQMLANISSGGYAWARYGFTPTEEAFTKKPDDETKWPISTVVGQMDQFLAASTGKKPLVKLSDKQREHIQGLRNELDLVCQGKSKNVGVIRKIAALDLEVKNYSKVFPEKSADLKEALDKKKGMTLGKALLLQTSWQADFQLDPDEETGRKSDMPYMKAYMGMRSEQDQKLARKLVSFGKAFGINKNLDMDFYKNHYDKLTQES